MKHTIAALAALIVSATGAQAATITNGGFEDSTFSGNFTTVFSGGTGVSGWDVGGNGVDLINTYWQNGSGSYSLDLSAGSAGEISQEVTDLVVGQTYTISFDMAGNPAGGNAEKSLGVTFGNVVLETFTFDTTGQSLANMGWTRKGFQFVADETSGLLTFTSAERSAFGPALDNVSISVSAVPLPASAMLLLAGIGGLGAMRRRQS